VSVDVAADGKRRGEPQPLGRMRDRVSVRDDTRGGYVRLHRLRNGQYAG